MKHIFLRAHFQSRVLVRILVFTAFILSFFATHTVQAEEPENVEGKLINLRIVAYNVACGQWATPEQVAAGLESLNPDVVFLNEVPKALAGKEIEDWSSRVAEKLGLQHIFVGSISSANHSAPKWSDVTNNYGGKFKSVLSRTPLTNGKDYALEGLGWSPAGIVRVETKIDDRKFALYSVHLPGRTDNWPESTHKKLAELIAEEDPTFDVIAAGDFNETTDSNVLQEMVITGDLKNAMPMPTTEYKNYCSKHGLYLTIIDHILYSNRTPVKVSKAKADWGPIKETELNIKTKGHLSDHPWVWCELKIPVNAFPSLPAKNAHT